jgi:hypothetical protein
MSASPRRVDKPELVMVCAGFALLSALCAGVGLMRAGGLQAHAPASVLAHRADLGEALQEAPWVASSEGGPIVWAVAGDSCRNCAAFLDRTLPGLNARGVEVRLVLTHPLGAAGEADDVVAELARTRDWNAFEHWREGKRQANFAGEDPAEQEGLVEWGRASYDRIAEVFQANKIDPSLPVLLWRKGPEWRVLTGPEALSIDRPLRDFEAEG